MVVLCLPSTSVECVFVRRKTGGLYRRNDLDRYPLQDQNGAPHLVFSKSLDPIYKAVLVVTVGRGVSMACRLFVVIDAEKVVDVEPREGKTCWSSKSSLTTSVDSNEMILSLLIILQGSVFSIKLASVSFY